MKKHIVALTSLAVTSCAFAWDGSGPSDTDLQSVDENGVITQGAYAGDSGLLLTGSQGSGIFAAKTGTAKSVWLKLGALTSSGNDGLFAGANGADVGTTNLEISGAATNINGNVFGGGLNGNVNGDTHVSMTGGLLKDRLFGGGESGATVTGDTHVSVSGGSFSAGALYGGGYAARSGSTVSGNTNIAISGAAQFGSVLDLSMYGMGTFVTTANIYGGGLADELAPNGVSSVGGSTSVAVNGGTIYGDVYGGGQDGQNGGGKSTVGQNTNVTVNGNTTIGYMSGDTLYGGNVFGGGQSWSSSLSSTENGVQKTGGGTQVLGSSNVTVDGGSILGSVYGGGVGSNIYAAGQTGGASEVKGGARVVVNGGTVQGNIYGGGLSGDFLEYDTATTPGTPIVVQAGAGGAAEVKGSVDILVSGGTIKGDIYSGGSGKNATVSGKATVSFVGEGANLAFSGTVYANGENGGVVLGEKSVRFGDGQTAFTGTFEGTIADGFDTLEVSAQSAVVFAQAFNVDTLVIDYSQAASPLARGAASAQASGATVELAEGTTFSTLEILSDFALSKGDTVSLGDVFGGSLSIVMYNLGLSDDSLKIVDNAGNAYALEVSGDGTVTVSDVTPVPEPAACALILGALALAAGRRRK